MNVSGLVLFFVVVFLAAVSALPTAGLGESPMELEPIIAEEPSEQEDMELRIPNVTCDILTVGIPVGSVNHSACALHCLSKGKGFKGGHCVDRICKCIK